ncbi:hypothetical protein ACP4TB_29520 [Streptomyces sp. DR3-1]|uniref:hypothetical protein n=1 Tax=Streptomyces sp. DR3-1 TaxID=2951169 RepID=UPI002043319B|nr:hypothetical protein [Streptomyces sp. DR3-1]MCM3822412.1 hypothetical protein [Streptomyces sp. DR3-1]
MAYAEKVYKVRNGVKTKQFTWRACYKKPDGSKGTEPGFPTKKLAEEWGTEQERLMKAGTWIDPQMRATTFGQFARVFMAVRKKRGRTTGTRWEKLEKLILPRWDDVPLGAISWFDVDAWQQTMTVEDVTRGHCVSLMSTIMTAAVDANYIVANPLFGRRRTRETAGNAARLKVPKMPNGARPEDVILIAERLGPTKGLHVLTTAFTGPRWGEGIALRRENILLERRQPWGAGIFVCRTIRIVEEYAEYQARDEFGNKQGYTLQLEPTKNDGSTRDVDVPPFLATLLRYHLQDWPFELVFSTGSGTPWRRGNWGKRIRPAADGAPPRMGNRYTLSRPRWEPIAPGLDMRALRALHDTMQAEIGVKEPLAFEAAGHRQPGIKRHYQKPTPAMRAERLNGLDAIFWKAMANVGLRALWGRVDLRKGP